MRGLFNMSARPHTSHRCEAAQTTAHMRVHDQERATANPRDKYRLFLDIVHMSPS